VYRRRADHEAAAFPEDHQGKLGRRDRTFRRWRLRPLRGGKGLHRPLRGYLAQDLGPLGITANCMAPGVIATGRIMQTVIPGSSQSNRDRAELVALRRLGTVEDCAKVVEFLATDMSDYVTGAVLPIDGGLVRG
jgi:hypothetical protein